MPASVYEEMLGLTSPRGVRHVLRFAGGGRRAGLLSEPGRAAFFQDLLLLAENPILTPQLVQMLLAHAVESSEGTVRARESGHPAA